jgi:hypothetical protein
MLCVIMLSVVLLSAVTLGVTYGECRKLAQYAELSGHLDACLNAI